MINHYRGLYLVGDKAANRITNVHVVDTGGKSSPLLLGYYAGYGVQPEYRTLPWWDDVKITQAKPIAR
jgi:hypothetical protein